MAAKWTDKERVARWFRTPLNRPADWLEQHADQQLLDAFEAFMFPAPAAETVAAQLARFSRELRVLGFDEKSDLVTQLESEAARLRELVREGGELGDGELE